MQYLRYSTNWIPNWIRRIHYWNDEGCIMTLTEAVIYLNREMEDLAIKEDFPLLERLGIIKNKILEHSCQKPRKSKK